MFGLDNAINEINNNFAGKFDKDVVDAWVRLFMKKDFALGEFGE